jgi:ABC-2 type transport system ATP-binding protein
VSAATPATPALIEARGLTKQYGSLLALDHVQFAVEPGRIVGLIGPNGAGKTTALRAILGLTSYEGELRVLGREPFKDRAVLMNEASFIADVAVLPSWLRVEQAIAFVAGVHPRFRIERAQELLAKTEISGRRRIGELSKGMKTMVHLALTMALDAKLLVLDEPTLGLDILARRGFYDALVNDYMDDTRTVLITTHQVEEIENLLTDVLFIDKGRIVLDCSLENIAARYAALCVSDDKLEAARAERPFYERRMLGKTELYFERDFGKDGADRGRIAGLGELRTPSVSDLFVAKLSAGRAA